VATVTFPLININFLSKILGCTSCIIWICVQWRCLTYPVLIIPTFFILLRVLTLIQVVQLQFDPTYWILHCNIR
jgi:MFS superfamily sulfate permease-like transporter